MYCRYVVYDIYIYLYGVCSYSCIHIFDYAQVYIYIYTVQREREGECMISINRARKAEPQKLWYLTCAGGGCGGM